MLCGQWCGWWVAPSTGSGFGTPSRWVNGYGAGSSKQMAGDVTGGSPSTADFVAYFGGTNGWWYVGASNGSGIYNWGLYASGFGVDSQERFLADVTDDGKADGIVYHALEGKWFVRPSNGYNVPFSNPSEWKSGFGQGS